MDNSSTLMVLLKFSFAIIAIPLFVLYVGAVHLKGEFLYRRARLTCFAVQCANVTVSAEYTAALGDPWIVSGGAAALVVNIILTVYVITAWNDPEPAGRGAPSSQAEGASETAAPVIPPSFKGGKAQ